MTSEQLHTENSSVVLLQPSIERDAPLSLAWLHGELGKQTLSAMGVPLEKIHEPTIEEERERIRNFISNNDQYNWMISYEDRIVGSIWVDLKDKEGVRAPSVHLMIGDPSTRGKGIGLAATRAVVNYLIEAGNTVIYSRHLTANKAAANLLFDLGFTPDRESYRDADDLNWQNVSLSISSNP